MGVVSILKTLDPFLADLAKAGSPPKELKDQIDSDYWIRISSLWKRLHDRLGAEPTIRLDVSDAPDDAEFLLLIRLRLQKILLEDPALVNEVSETLAGIRHPTTLTSRVGRYISPHKKAIVLLGLAAPIVITVFWLLLVVIPAQVVPLRSTPALTGITKARRIELQDARLKLRNEFRTTLVQAIGGALLVVGGVATWRQLRISSQQLQVNRAQLQSNEEASRRQLEINEQGQITERFTRAIEQMGSDKPSIRLGAIYALERLANNSALDRRAIIEVLSAFVKSSSLLNPSGDHDNAAPFNAEVETSPETDASRLPDESLALVHLRDRAPDIQAAMTVLTRDSLAGGKDAPALYLPSVDLRMSDLRGADLSKAKLYNVKLDFAQLHEANLSGAALWNGSLKEASLLGANLQDASLHGADLRGAKLMSADLREAQLQKADMRDSRIQGADLRGAKLHGADLRGAVLTDAAVAWDVQGTLLGRINFGPARLQGALCDDLTRWPDTFDPEAAGVINSPEGTIAISS